MLRLLTVIATFLVTGAQAQTPVGFDGTIETILKRHDVAGASIAVARNGKLLFARGYGLADREARTPVSTVTRFRIASLSKPITAAAVLDLAGRGRLSLDTPIASLLGDAARVDPAARTVTVRHLLQHTSQWGVGASEIGGPDLDRLMARVGATEYARTPFARLARAALMDAPRSPPGSTFFYSTFGYCTLGTIIETVSGTKYEGAVRRAVLAPAGAPSFALAAGYTEGRLRDEARTYDYAGAPRYRFSVDGKTVERSRPDAYWPDDRDTTCAAAGRWIATPVDYLRVMASLAGRRSPAVGNPGTMRLLFENEGAVQAKKPGEQKFSHGLFFETTGHGTYWWHTGSYAGTATAYGRNDSGFEWAVAYNGRPSGDEIYADTFRGMWTTIRGTPAWPVGEPL